jgi:predicted aspartyl protease
MKFPYIKTPQSDPRKKWISRPIIPVTLFGPKGDIRVDALIDSGADKCLFNAEIGREIGLEIEKGEKEIFSGIEGGKIIAYLHKIKLQIIGIDMTIEIEAGFTDALGVIAILGQDGFFDAFKIKFEKDHDVIEITPVKSHDKLEKSI